ncbi:MAG: NAD-dependent deacylase [Verrucomicrobiaceae bacterium]|nr:MAG: NAD-dependent deacylase [Verrucomicrobiaceae bacterium]
MVSPEMNIVILTGAGISAESGIKTFRDENGLWEGYSVDQVATKLGFGANPELVNRFYNMRRKQLVEVGPNAAHTALVELEKQVGDGFLLITQNVDDLHERAGSRRLIHMHGELRRARCIWCEVISPCNGDLHASDFCRKCGRDMGMRPDVVWFGETPYELERIGKALEVADVFIAIGTSGIVEPASRFCVKAKVYGAKAIEVNLNETSKSSEFDEIIRGPASETVPALVSRLLQS